MKRLTLCMLAVCFACLLQACHGSHSSDGGADDDTDNMAADTIRAANVHVDKEDMLFVTNIIGACMAEIKAGTLAKQQGQDKRIRNFGVMMVKDLTKGNRRLLNLAKAKKIVTPDTLNAADQKEIAALAQKQGKDFDNAYLAKTRADHLKAQEMFRAAAKNSYDKDIKAFANKTLLTLQRHIDAIDAIRGSMK